MQFAHGAPRRNPPASRNNIVMHCGFGAACMWGWPKKVTPNDPIAEAGPCGRDAAGFSGAYHAGSGSRAQWPTRVAIVLLIPAQRGDRELRLQCREAIELLMIRRGSRPPRALPPCVRALAAIPAKSPTGVHEPGLHSG
jgi:hypothetical protein